MGWRKPTRRDIAAKLTQAELDKFSASPDFLSGADPVADVLELTAETVRGFCRTNKQLKMCPEAGTVPEGLMTFAMDFAAFDVLKRINHAPNEARTKAWEAAREMFAAVGRGEFIPESYQSEEEADDTSANRALPSFSETTNRRKILNSYPML